MPFRRHRQRLVERAAAVCARPIEIGHQTRGPAVGIALEQLDDRGRSLDLGFRHARRSVAPTSGWQGCTVSVERGSMDPLEAIRSAEVELQLAPALSPTEIDELAAE